MTRPDPVSVGMHTVIPRFQHPRPSTPMPQLSRTTPSFRPWCQPSSPSRLSQSHSTHAELCNVKICSARTLIDIGQDRYGSSLKPAARPGQPRAVHTAHRVGSRIPHCFRSRHVWTLWCADCCGHAPNSSCQFCSSVSFFAYILRSDCQFWMMKLPSSCSSSFHT